MLEDYIKGINNFQVHLYAVRLAPALIPYLQYPNDEQK